MDRKEMLSRAYSPRASTDPLFVRDTIGVALFGQAQDAVQGHSTAQMSPPATTVPVVPSAPAPGLERTLPSPLTIPGPMTREIIESLPDTGPSLDDFTRHGTLPGFGDAAQDPYGSALRRRLTVLLRSM